MEKVQSIEVLGKKLIAKTQGKRGINAAEGYNLSWICTQYFAKTTERNVYFVYFHLKGQITATFGTKYHQNWVV